MPPSVVFLAVAVVTSLAATVATSTGNTNLFRWLDCPSPPSSLSSIFHSNVLTLLDELPSAAAPTGFASLILSRGEEGGDDSAFVRGLCRGDSTSDDCARCLRSAVLGINRRCSSNNRRRAGIWYGKCFLGYADTNASTTYEEGFRQELYSHGHRRSVSHRDRAASEFDERYSDLVIRISDRAANGGSSLAVPMFATGEETVYGRGRRGGRRNGTMYGMAQCMRDRTAAECALCLWKSMEQQAAATGVMLGYNCYLRVQMYPFYDLALDALPAPPPAPSPTTFMPTIGEKVDRNEGSVGAIAGGIVGGVVALLLAGMIVYVMFYRGRKAGMLPFTQDSTLLATTTPSKDKTALYGSQAGIASAVSGITIDKSVEFSYKELFNATEGFKMSNKIGQGGFGAVYYAKIRGKEAAIKKMDMQATHEFLAELKVLTHVHHMNLVHLIGYCVESSLFIVYEYIENGNLHQHLHATGYQPLSWAVRVQIALDSARGLEYIHEHTVPVYIHRDIKSANILINKNYRAKVADFGLTKLSKGRNTPLLTRGIVGTFGYMPPECGQYSNISPKVDVYAFGVVLYELISGKEAVVRPTEPCSDPKGLVYLFEEALHTSDPKEGLQRLIDPALGKDYPMDSILEMTDLARACTQKDPKSRPTMRSVVVALMKLSVTSTSCRVLGHENDPGENPGQAW